MKIGKVLLAGAVVAIFHFLWGFLTCGWLFNWVYALEPTYVWKPVEELFVAHIAIADFIFCPVLALFYALIHKELPGKCFCSKGSSFGFFIWFLGGLKGSVWTWLTMNVACEVPIYWGVSLFFLDIFSGMIIAKVYGK